jgi:hypothetical protein
MPTANLNNPTTATIDTGMESIVIVRNLDAVRGGRTLDVTGFTPTVIQAGHLIIKSATGVYKPMPVTMAGGVATGYAALPASHTYEGVLIAGVLTAKPFAGILTQGTVNPLASPFPPTAGAIAALINIQFRAD